jgi:hypothetical protein
MCPATLTTAENSLAPRHKSKVSFPKLEKVVNPPRTPTKINALASEGNMPRDSASRDRKPMTRHPVRFMTSVAKGNFSLAGHREKKSPIEYLRIEPMKPPAPANNIFHMMTPP